jgi:hypothetical protein
MTSCGAIRRIEIGHARRKARIVSQRNRNAKEYVERDSLVIM